MEDQGLRKNGRVWLVAAVYWACVTLLCLVVNPAMRDDALSRYAPMADAFARGDWFFAFHPRFGTFFQAVSGSIAFLFGIGGDRATPIAAFLMMTLAAVSVWQKDLRDISRTTTVVR